MSDCHNSADKRAGYDLSNYEGIMLGVTPHHPLLSDVYNAIKGHNPSMPQRPYSKLSSKDVELIKLWINAGASKSSNCVSCDSTDHAYSTRIASIMSSWCIGCHNSSNKSGNVDLSAFSGVSSAITNNHLLESIKQLPGYTAMPQGGQKMDDCDIQAIEKWISSGYPNN